MPQVPERDVPHDLPDDGGTDLVGMTGGIALSERDLGRNRPPRKRRFPFGFHAAAYDTAGYDRVRNRHHNTVRRTR